MENLLEDDIGRVVASIHEEDSPSKALSRSLSHYLGAGATTRYPDAELELSSVPDWQSAAESDYDSVLELEERQRLSLMPPAERQRREMLAAWTRAGPPSDITHRDTILVQLRTEDGDEMLEVRPTDEVHRTIRMQLGLRGKKKKNAALRLTHAGEEIVSGLEVHPYRLYFSPLTLLCLQSDDGMSFEDWEIFDGATIHLLELGPAPITLEKACRKYAVSHINEQR